MAMVADYHYCHCFFSFDRIHGFCGPLAHLVYLDNCTGELM